MRPDALLNNAGLRLGLSPILLPAAALYALGLGLHRRAASARRRSLPVPTISIGNITVGGTGKTPVLLRLVSDLRAMGRRPFVLTRGYAGVGNERAEGIVRSAAEAASFSDEVRLMAEVLGGVPIGAGADRFASAEEILSGGSEDVAVLDDGFQHWKLARDLDVVCLDATDPWGGGFLLPMGRLRECRGALERAHIVVITRGERVEPERLRRIAEAASRLVPRGIVIKTRFELKLVLPDGKAAPAVPGRALAISAIGNPAAFEANLAALGVEPLPVRFADHHAYSERDWNTLTARARALGVPLVTTAKDWVKLRAFARDGGPVVLIAAQSLAFDDAGLGAWHNRIRAAVVNR